MQDRQRKLAALMGMASNFGKEFSRETLTMWMKLLEKYSPEAVEHASEQTILTYEYRAIPPFAVFAKFLPHLNGALPEDRGKRQALKADSEWNALLDAIGQYGSYREPKLHPTTERVVRNMGGWQVICQWKTEELQWRRKEFLEKWVEFDGYATALDAGARAIERREAIEQRQLNASPELDQFKKRIFKLAEGA